MEFLLDVFKIYFKEYNLFTTLCLFMLHSKIIQLYKYIYIYMYIYIYTHTHSFHILFHYGLSQNIEYSYLSYWPPGWH